MSTALGVSPFAMRLFPISCAENCFLRMSARPEMFLAALFPPPFYPLALDSPRERCRELDSVNRVRQILRRDKLSHLAQRSIRVERLDERRSANVQADLEASLRRLGRLAATADA